MEFVIDNQYTLLCIGLAKLPLGSIRHQNKKKYSRGKFKKIKTRSDILQGQALFRRDKQHLTKDVFCLSLSIKNKKVPKQDWKRERKGRELRIDWREYKEQSKRVGNQRESKERESRESAEIDGEWGQREQEK